MPRFTFPLNVLVEPSTAEMLKQVSANSGVSVAHMVRTSLRAYLRATLYQNPTCATGEACRMQNPAGPGLPSTFPTQPPAPLPNPDRLPNS